MINPPIPQIDQLGHVVKDIHAAIRHWTDVMHVGPFFFNENSPLLDFTYRGKPSDGRLHIASAYLGNLQIELIQPLDTKPSAFTDFLKSGYEGLQHIGYITERFDETLAACQAAGMEFVQGGKSVLEASTRYCYLNPNAPIGSMVELVGCGPQKKKIFQTMADAAVGWDGRNPVREMPVV